MHVYLYTKSHKFYPNHINFSTYVYTHTNTCTYTHTYIWMHTHTHTHTHTRTHTHVYMYMYIYVYMCTCTHVYIFIIIVLMRSGLRATSWDERSRRCAPLLQAMHRPYGVWVAESIICQVLFEIGRLRRAIWNRRSFITDVRFWIGRLPFGTLPGDIRSEIRRLPTGEGRNTSNRTSPGKFEVGFRKKETSDLKRNEKNREKRGILQSECRWPYPFWLLVAKKSIDWIPVAIFFFWFWIFIFFFDI